MPPLAFPTAFGQWQLERDTLVCHLPSRTVSVTAPARLLRAVMALCNGRVAWRDVAAQLARRWSAAPVEAFLVELSREGVLVDPHACRPGGEGEETFSGEPIAADALATLLRAGHGAASQSVRWLVLAVRDVPGHGVRTLAPALYACRFRQGSGVSFVRAARRSEFEAWALLADPRPLQFAAAVILPCCEASEGVAVMRALQAARQTAAASGLACQLRTDVRSDALGRWLPPQALVSACLLVGMPPSAEQAERERAVRWMQLRPARPSPAEYALPVTAAHAYVAGPIRLGASQEIYGTGRSADAREAAVKAEAEAWERLGWATLGATVVARGRELEDALDPRSVAAYTAAQHARPGFPWKPYSPERAYAWVRGVETATGRSVRLPAECIHALSAVPQRLRRRACTNASTSGVAAWTDAQGALCRATLELVERDAFLRAWVARMPLPQMATATLPASALVRVRNLEAAGHRVAVLPLPAALACVFAVFVQSTTRAFTAVAAAADFDAEAALDRALHETEARVLHAAAFAALPLRAASEVACLEDIPRLYQSPRWYRHADFLAAGPAVHRFGAQRAACRDWAGFRHALGQQGYRLFAFDLTPPHASLHQGRTPLHVVRAVIPGLIPIWFRPGLEPAGLPAYRRAARAGRSHAVRRSSVIHPFT